MTMTKEKALNYVASKLALNTWESRRRARFDPNLREVTDILADLNRAACEALGDEVLTDYDSALSLITR